MKITDEQSNLIDAYIKKQLTGEDLEAFENELKTNSALKEELAFRQNIADVIQLKKVKAAIEKAKSDPLVGAATERKIEHPQLEVVHNMMQQTKEKNTRQKKRRIRRILIAGIAASLLLLVWIGIKFLQPTTLPQLADRHFSVFPKAKLNEVTVGLEPVSDNSSEQQQKLMLGAEQAYKNGNWAKVDTIFRELRNQHGYENDAMSLYEGIIFYQKKDYRTATQRFESIIRKPKSNVSVKQEAQWYLGLLYLKTKEKDRAKEQFKIVSQTSTTYRRKANRILQKLN